MPKMKDSGIEWVGQIPADWKTMKLNYASETITDYTASGSFADLAANVTYLDEEDYAMLVRTADLSAKREMANIYVNQHSYDYLRNSNLFGGEIILPNVGSVGEVYYYMPMYERATLAPNAIMIRTKGCSKYLYYLFSTKQYGSALKGLANATTQAKFNKTQLRKMKVIQPSLSEQERIASFLDRKCSEIDLLRADIEAEIETLEEYKKSVITEAVTKGLNPDVEMKDSGIEWVERIPSTWKTTKVKYLFNSGKGLGITKDNLIDEGLPVISYGQIHSKDNDGVSLAPQLLRFVDCSYKRLFPQCEVEKYDFVFADTSEDYDGCGNCVYKRDDNVVFFFFFSIDMHSKYKKDNRFLAYLFLTDDWRKQIRSYVSGVKVFSVTNKLIMNTSVVLPPEEEQRIISDYLDMKCKEINEIIQARKEQIEIFTEYKKSLIYEYVTGKKEVPNE